MRTLVSALALVAAFASSPALAADTYKEDLTKVVSHGILIGRAAGCDIDTELMKSRAELFVWANLSGPRREEAKEVLEMAIRYHTALQRSGKAPETCDDIRELLGH